MKPGEWLRLWRAVPLGNMEKRDRVLLHKHIYTYTLNSMLVTGPWAPVFGSSGGITLQATWSNAVANFYNCNACSTLSKIVPGKYGAKGKVTTT